MKRKTTIAVSFLSFVTGCLLLAACGGSETKKTETTDQKPAETQDNTNTGTEVHGPEIKEGDITLANPLNADWVKNLAAKGRP